ncbi:MAG: D-2-hydroxyacid dehydrogenase [Anaerolineae bacterium]
MKIILPAFMLPALQEKSCELLEACEFVVVEENGAFSTSPEGAEVLMLPWGLDESTRRRLLSLPTLKWIHSVSAGVEHALDEVNVTLTNARGVFDLPIAETVLTYILMIAKRMPEFAAQQQARTWKKLKLREAADLTVGLVGSGSIGTQIARLCRALEMRVIATRRHPECETPYVDEVLPTDALETLLSQADVVVLAVPLTAETRGLIGAPQLRQMRPEAWLVNIARGAVVDEAALVEALQRGEIAGAALDVFTEEPLPPDSPLWEMDNVILTPHNAWSTPHVREREAALFLQNLRRYLRGEPLLNVVDRELGY